MKELELGENESFGLATFSEIARKRQTLSILPHLKKLNVMPSVHQTDLDNFMLFLNPGLVHLAIPLPPEESMVVMI